MAKIDLKEKTITELAKDLAENREELRKMRFNVAGTKGLKANAVSLRKAVAQIMTELRNRQK